MFKKQSQIVFPFLPLTFVYRTLPYMSYDALPYLHLHYPVIPYHTLPYLHLSYLSLSDLTC